MEGCIKPVIKSYPDEELPDTVVAQEEIIRAANRKLLDAPPFEAKDEAAWKKFLRSSEQDPYELTYVRYAVRWARLMQTEMTPNWRFFDVAVAAAREAGLPASGSDESTKMWFLARGVVLTHWKHTGAFRKLSNQRYERLEQEILREHVTA